MLKSHTILWNLVCSILSIQCILNRICSDMLKVYFFVLTLLRAVAAEICEELFTPSPPHAELALNGVEVFMNASGSHHQLRKLDVRLRAFIGATHTRGGVYMYSNHQGCDGARLYYGMRFLLMESTLFSVAVETSLSLSFS